MGPTGGIKKKSMKKGMVGIKKEAHQNGFEDWWDDFSKRLHGSSSQLKKKPRFRSFLKISGNTFNYIVSLVKSRMAAKQVNLTDESGKLLCLNDRVAIALRRLSSGESLSAVGDLLGINRSTVAQITKCFVDAMEEGGLHHLHWPSTVMEIKEIKSGFENFSGLPNCCGAIDTTHVLMSPSSADGSNDIWRDREDNHSMIIQAIVGPDMRFLDIVTGWPGSLSDSVALNSSVFCRLAEDGKLLNGEKIRISEETELGEYIVGDMGFPLMPWLLTPYKGRKLSDTEAKFNERINATIIVAKRALTRLKERWRVVNGVMWRPDKNRLPRIVLVCCILHNIVIDLEGADVGVEEPLSHDHDPGYGQQVCKSNDKRATDMRQKLSLYLSCRLHP